MYLASRRSLLLFCVKIFPYSDRLRKLRHSFINAVTVKLLLRCACAESQKMQQNQKIAVMRNCGNNVKFSLIWVLSKESYIIQQLREKIGSLTEFNVKKALNSTKIDLLNYSVNHLLVHQFIRLWIILSFLRDSTLLRSNSKVDSEIIF